MKRCPQCNTAYNDETQYCLNDGAVLIEEAAPDANFNDDEETIIRHDPIIVDVAQPNEPIYQVSPRPTIIVEKQRNTGKYLLFLIVGLILGGALVLAGLLIARTFNREDESANVKMNNKNQAEKVVVSNQTVNAAVPNANFIENNVNAVESNKIHEGKTSVDDEEFNGRVITLNAYVRSAPSKSSSQVAILPKDDRIKIGERENPNSPWYRVTCDHGVSGWMHGDTIEFTE